MSRESLHHPAAMAPSPRFSRRLFFPAAFWMLVICLCVPVAARSRTEQPVHTFSLLPGIVAKVQADGALVLNTGPDAAPLLSAEVVPLTDSRRSRGRSGLPFLAVVAEGASGGQRGFSTNRDDDNDGATDEDALDGRDNDGDGLIDEDFAAISDAMVVVHQDLRQGGGRAAHLEYYHWAYPHLRSTVFLAAKGSPGLSNGGTYRLVLGDQRWRETALVSGRHTLAGKTETNHVNAFVAQPSRPDRLDHATDPVGATSCDPGAKIWVGVVVLTESPRTRAVLDGGVLDLQLGEDPLMMAICVAESWLKLNHMLNETVRVRAGVTDKITGRQAPWIVPPLCAQCRLAVAPDFSWTRSADGDLHLTAKISAGCCGALDPDLFRLSGRFLGAPLEIRWQPDKGQIESVPWLCMNAAMLSRPHDRLSNPYARMPGLMDHQGAGRLRFAFSVSDSDIPGGQDQITGTYLDGRPFTAQLTAAPTTTPETNPGNPFLAEARSAELAAGPTDQAQLLKSSDQNPTLSRQLLEGFPNPFRDQIQLRFVVPATMGEAFVWEKDADPPAGLDLSAAIPWKSGTPKISVKIYSINGQELVTLYSGSQGPGENMVQWSGTDSYGRQVASGTYFCKLQMDNWSVTRRLVFLR